MMMVCACSNWHSAVLDIRSLVLARDDVSRALCSIRGCMPCFDRRT